MCAMWPMGLVFFHRITMAICDPDSTTVYYTINQGLVNPEHPDATEVKKVKRFETTRKRQLGVQEAIQTYKAAKLTDRAALSNSEGRDSLM